LSASALKDWADAPHTAAHNAAAIQMRNEKGAAAVSFISSPDFFIKRSFTDTHAD
jgi:hypothetical protein